MNNQETRKPNKAFLGTLHKVSGPQNADVRHCTEKKMILRQFVLLTALVLTTSCASPDLPAKITLVVKDDHSVPVAGCTVRGCFTDVSQSGSRTVFDGHTTANGVYVAKGRAQVGIYARVTREGYYMTTVERDIGAHYRLNGGWDHDRWVEEIPVLLKPIRNPIHMVQGEIDIRGTHAWVARGLHNTNNTASYDLCCGDYLPPYGKGTVADMQFRWDVKINVTNAAGRALDYATRWDLAMTNGQDGVCRGQPDGGRGEHGREGSFFIPAYEAPLTGYTNNIVFWDNVCGSKRESNDDHHSLYYFRIRTQTDQAGQVTNAVYGQIHGRINVSFTYSLNPTVNDRNMEADTYREMCRKFEK